METKVCKRCEETRELKGFYIAPLNTDGHSGTCIECYKKLSKSSWVIKKKDTKKLSWKNNKTTGSAYIENLEKQVKDGAE